MTLTDEQIAAMSPQQRLDLVRRLRVTGGPHDPRAELIRRGNRRRSIAMLVTTACSILLVPWVIYLAFELPDRHVAPLWSLTWVGYDFGLIVLFAATAFLAWRRRLMVVVTAFATGIMLLADAWFDLTTAGPGGRLEAALEAGLVEVPLAIFMIGVSVHLLSRLTNLLPLQTHRHWESELDPSMFS